MTDSDDDGRSGLGSIDDGDEFRYEEEGSAAGSRRGSPDVTAEKAADVIQNQPHDEEVEVSSDEGSVESPTSATGGAQAAGDEGGEAVQVENAPFDEAINVSDEESCSSEETGSPSKQGSPAQQAGLDQSAALETPTRLPQGSDESEDSSSDSEGDGMEAGEQVFTGEEGGYDPKEFEDLDVSAEIRDLFQYIGRHNPHKIELESPLMPFVPDFIPAVGDIDAFIKLPRPDGVSDQLGVTMLDEPAVTQSDPSVIEMQLRHMSKNLNVGDAVVTMVQNAEKNPKAIKAWIQSIDDLHSSKPPTDVTYSKPMPDIESLMQVWPPEFEDELSRTQLPSKDLDMPLEDYARIVCTLFDIPVYNNVTESLHVLFSLYSEFKNNDHFRNEMDAALSPGQMGPMGDPMGGPNMFGEGGDADFNMAGPPDLGVVGSPFSPSIPSTKAEHEVNEIGDEINPPPITYHSMPQPAM